MRTCENMPKNENFVQYLESCGVCDICLSRYLNRRKNEKKNLEEVFKKSQDKYKIDEKNNSAKKTRVNPCVTCLGLFSEELKTSIMKDITDLNMQKYDCKGVVVALSLPISLQIRQLSMWYALIRKFGDKIRNDCAPDVPLKETAKLILNSIIYENFSKNHDVNGVMINISLTHLNEKSEILKAFQASEALENPKNLHWRKKKISRAYIETRFAPSLLPITVFEKFISIPPSIPESGLIIQNITLKGPTVFVAGRYRKLSRKLSHTPWILGGKRVMEDSIQDILIRNVAPFFCDGGKTTFSSSGREDVDVRCLGKGRPFVLEVNNALRVTLPKQIARDMEFKISKTRLLSVKNLQIVHRNDLSQLKNGEENKRKIYRALCTFVDPVRIEEMEKLNITSQFEILQKTPIRVLHRRPLHTRQRTVYSVKASMHEMYSRAVILDIVTQAGTYIKELVHGEFGRTVPNISSIAGVSVDIIALDVVGIDLDWPENINN